MSTSLEKTSHLGRKLSVTIPSAEIDKRYNKELNETCKKAKLEGFRPGKAPKDVIEKRYGESVRGDVINKLIQDTLFDTIEAEGCKLADRPTVEEIKAEKGQDLFYVATFEELPTVELADFSKIKVEKDVVEISDADIDGTIDNIRKQQSNWTTVERAAKLADRLVIDFIGYIDDVAFPGGTANDMNLVLGSGTFIPGFEDSLVGAKAGDKKDVMVTFPESYHAKDLAGKPAKFVVTVKAVQEASLADVDEEFIKRFGIASGSIEEFRDQIKMHMTRELNYRLRNTLKNQVMKQLSEINTLEIPNVLIEREADFLHEQMHKHDGHGHHHEEHEHHAHPELKQEAKDRVKLSLIISHITKEFAIKADPQRAMELLFEAASSYEDKNAVLNYIANDKKQMQHFYALAQEDAVVDFVLSKATVTENNKHYNDIMQG